MSENLELQAVVKCPSCWNQFKPEEILWISPDDEADPAIDLGDDKRRRFLPSRFDLDGFAIDANGTSCQSLACPKCHLVIPRALIEIKPLFVSIIGAPSSGKSYFLAAAVWEARKRFREFSATFVDADPVANQIISGYEQKLFLNDHPEQMVAIPKTQTDSELYQLVDYGGKRQELYARPFVFSMRPDKDHYQLKRNKNVRLLSRALCLYDNAGEHFKPTAESALSPATDHLALSESMLYVFDPIQHAGFRAKCREFSKDPQLKDNFKIHRQDEVLAEAAKRIRQKTNLAEHERIKKPLIVIVNKYDVWRDMLPVLDLENRSPYRRASQGVLTIDRSLLQKVSDLLAKLLRETAPDIVAVCEAFCDDITYLPVSSQGCSPVVSESNPSLLGVRPEEISPIWAEVPLLYAINRGKCFLIPTGETSAKSTNHTDDWTAPKVFRGEAS